MAIPASKSNVAERRGVKTAPVVLPEDVGVVLVHKIASIVDGLELAEVDLLFGQSCFGVERGEGNFRVARTDGFFEACFVGAGTNHICRCGGETGGLQGI